MLRPDHVRRLGYELTLAGHAEETVHRELRVAEGRTLEGTAERKDPPPTGALWDLASREAPDERAALDPDGLISPGYGIA